MNTSLSFAHPWMLLGLLLPALLAIYWRGGRSRVAFPLDNAVHRRRRLLGIALTAASAIPLLILALAAVLLAEPQTMQVPEERRRMTHIQICLDVSGSMAADDPPRYTHAQAAIDSFTRAREGDAMGLILFGIQQLRLVPITEDVAAIRSLLPLIDPNKQGNFMRGGTYIGAALKYVTKVMLAESLTEEADRVVILVSDGQSQDLDAGDQHDIANLLRAAGVRLFYLHISKDESPQSEVNEIARATGGHGFVASDRQGTIDVFKRIDRMTKTDFQAIAQQSVDGFRPSSVAILGLCAAHAICLFGLRYNPW